MVPQISSALPALFPPINTRRRVLIVPLIRLSGASRPLPARTFFPRISDCRLFGAFRPLPTLHLPTDVPRDSACSALSTLSAPDHPRDSAAPRSPPSSRESAAAAGSGLSSLFPPFTTRPSSLVVPLLVRVFQLFPTLHHPTIVPRCSVACSGSSSLFPPFSIRPSSLVVPPLIRGFPAFSHPSPPDHRPSSFRRLVGVTRPLPPLVWHYITAVSVDSELPIQVVAHLTLHLVDLSQCEHSLRNNAHDLFK
ncbi:hypothetical protein R3P38DRAFT_3433953 [Favolaschia claudopus]|uniref:Uncharacterized protein n=1 Tax=Favolaschia claudopus TaxID=2862362 RepID=A0AAW0D305_9AGAR